MALAMVYFPELGVLYHERIHNYHLRHRHHHYYPHIPTLYALFYKFDALLRLSLPLFSPHFQDLNQITFTTTTTTTNHSTSLRSVTLLVPHTMLASRSPQLFRSLQYQTRRRPHTASSYWPHLSRREWYILLNMDSHNLLSFPFSTWIWCTLYSILSNISPAPLSPTPKYT